MPREISTFGKWFIPFAVFTSTAMIYYSLQTSITLSNQEASRKALEIRRKTQEMKGRTIDEAALLGEGRPKRWTGRDWE